METIQAACKTGGIQMESLLNCLPYINPDDYETWITVGMALKHEGYSCSDWDAWSAESTKYKAGVCEKKWKSFNETNSGEIVTGGTVFQMARDNGYRGSDQAFGWDDEVNEIGLDYKIIDPGFVKEQALPGMKGEPIDDLREYLHLVFHESDYVGYCDKLDFIDGKWVPVNGLKSRTAGQLLEDLKNGFEHSTIRGESEGGAMIRFNPIDGKGEKDANVTDFRYCMVESDKDSIEKQYALYQEMKLPIICLVHSGNKSLHAIIHVDAGQDYREYQKRVNFIYDFCKKNGLNVDPNDKNASRYSRLPGIKRGENYQYIVARNIGFSTYEEWKQWADAQNDAEKMLEFKSKLLNVFTAASVQEWISAEEIKQLQRKFTPADFVGRPETMVALDLSVYDDFSAAAYAAYHKTAEIFKAFGKNESRTSGNTGQV